VRQKLLQCTLLLKAANVSVIVKMLWCCVVAGGLGWVFHGRDDHILSMYLRFLIAVTLYYVLCFKTEFVFHSENP
jgi:hypothetical protein